MTDLREKVAQEIAFAGRSIHDVSRDAAHHWSCIGEDAQRRAFRQADAILDLVLEEAAAHFDALAEATPLGHENEQRGASTYNWLRAHAAIIRALKAPKP